MPRVLSDLQANFLHDLTQGALVQHLLRRSVRSRHFLVIVLADLAVLSALAKSRGLAPRWIGARYDGNGLPLIFMVHCGPLYQVLVALLFGGYNHLSSDRRTPLFYLRKHR